MWEFICGATLVIALLSLIVGGNNTRRIEILEKEKRELFKQ